MKRQASFVVGLALVCGCSSSPGTSPASQWNESATSSSAPAPQASGAKVETKEFNSKGISGIVVENVTGNVKITATEEAKASVTSVKNQFSNKCKMSVAQTGKNLIVKVERQSPSVPATECNVDLDLKIPKKQNIKVTLGAGTLNTTGTEGSLNFAIGRGKVSAEGSFAGVTGEGGQAEIDLKGLTGGGQLRVGTGEIQVGYATTPKNGRIRIETGKANATVMFPKGSQIRSNFVSQRGKLNNKLGESPEATFAVIMNAAAGNLKIGSY